MLQRQRPLSVRRQAFTLVELLVVILIISILSALLTVGVSAAIGKAKKTRNQVDISQLALAVEAFKARYHVDYIPSRLYLSETGKTYITAPNVPIVADSFGYLQRIWPRLGSGIDPNTKSFIVSIDWNGSGRIETAGNQVSTLTNPNGDMILEGDQVLAFLLGGIPRMDLSTGVCSCMGFAKNPSNPAAHVANSTIPADNPMFEFDSSRLVNIHPSSFFMLSYLDTYGVSDPKMNLVCKGNRDINDNITGVPYAYFSSYGNRNGYNRYISPSLASECLLLGLNPYAQASLQYLNPTGFQIISAGADQTFGAGSSNAGTAPFWTPSNAANSGATGPNGADDQANFYSSILGTPSVN